MSPSSDVIDSVNLPLRKLPGLVMNVNVTVTREFRFRLWLALKLMALASWVLGGRVEVNEIET